MSHSDSQITDNPSPAPMIPDAPILVAGIRSAVWISTDGEIETLRPAEAAKRIRPGIMPMVCHGMASARKLQTNPFPCFDLLELFAFVRPASFTLPTPAGLAEAVGAPLPINQELAALSLLESAQILLRELGSQRSRKSSKAAIATAWAMHRGKWPWALAVLHALGAGNSSPHADSILRGLRVWQSLPEWKESAPEAPPGNFPVEAVEARARLIKLRGAKAEDRTEQMDYTSTAAGAFAPRNREGEPHVVLSEAGTGVGKTLGYIAPASLWAEKNQAPVWISTFTRNLQRQLDDELDRLYPDPAEKNAHIVVRKGRENYLCLLNMEEALRRLTTSAASSAIPLGLMARWALATRDGDMVGGDFPSWLVDLLGRSLTTDLTDTRGECIHSACDHYRKCFIEHTIRRAKTANIVVANHALVMIQAALGGNEEGQLPLRYVFDEGHHLFQAADSAFSANLSGRDTAELRRWLIGAEEGSSSRSRGLRTRANDLINDDSRSVNLLEDILRAARSLPGPAWSQRISGETSTGPAEAFLVLVRQQVYARNHDAGSIYSLETDTASPVPGLLEAAGKLESSLADLGRPTAELIQRLEAMLDADADDLDSATRSRIEALCRSLEARAIQQIAGWRSMLKSLIDDQDSENDDNFCDWFGIDRIEGRDFDVGFHRHWIDPTRPFAKSLVMPSHGVLITSATLRDHTDGKLDWETAEARCGIPHLAKPVNQPLMRSAVTSPFDYPRLTRVLVVTDVSRNNNDQIAAAYRELFIAAGGGGLGLFTAITRLRAVHQKICGPLEDADIPLYAQHFDPMDTGTLVDIFRAEEDSCLLGTDAVRDGVDVPGRSLRMIVFDRVPWPRPDILHKARRSEFGGRGYDEMQTRLKLKQAYGRLVRRATDRGIFIMLDPGMPSRLANAFPEGVEIERVGLKEAIEISRDFLAEQK